MMDVMMDVMMVIVMVVIIERCMLLSVVRIPPLWCEMCMDE